MPMFTYHKMQFKELGSMFGNLDEMSGKRFKGVTDFDNMQNWQKDSFNYAFQIDSSGISKYTSEEIKAKSATMGLSDELAAQALAMANDATFSAKAATGKLTWGQALKDEKISTQELVEALKNSSTVGDTAKESLQRLGEKSGTTEKQLKNLAKSVINGEAGFENISETIVDLGSNMNESTGFFSSTGTALKGMLASLKAMLPIIAAVGAAVAAWKIFEYVNTGYTRATEKMNESVQAYQEEQQNLDSLNSKLDETKSRIEELQALQANGTITFAEENELEKLQTTNAELQQQIELQQQLVDIKQQAAVNDTKKAASTNQSWYEYNKEQHGFWGGLLYTIGGLQSMPTEVDKFGNVINQTSEYQKWKEQNSNDTTIPGQLKGNIKHLEEQEAELKKLQTTQDRTSESYKNQEQAKQEQIANTKAAIAEQVSTIQGYIDGVTDSQGNITKGAEASVREWKSILNDYNNIGKTKNEKDYNNLENYFTSSKAGSTMKEYLKDLASQGLSATEALNKFRETGMRLNDIGVSENGFKRYFEDIKKAAKEAEDSVVSVDGTFEGMKAAAESANQGANYDTTMGYYKTAKEAFEKGLVGTDDFKTIAQFGVGYDIEKKLKSNADAYTYASDAYVEAWKKASPLLERWYGDEDELVNMNNILNDFEKAGLVSQSGDEWLFKNKDGSMKFKTTAEAAKKLETSVSNVELAMSKLEEHGFEFDGIEKSGELLEGYKSSLDSIKDVYDSMSDGDSKDRLKKLIDGYDTEYDKFKEDLSGLSEDQIVKIKFEYDLASIQQKVQELQEQANASGSNQDWASTTVAQKQLKDLLEKETGYTSDSDKGYAAYDNKIKELRKSQAGKSEDERAEINKEISAVYDLQNAFQQFRLDGGELDWKSFLDTPTATALFNDLVEQGTLTEKQLKDLFGDSITYEVDAELNDSELQEKLDKLAKNKTITFTAQVDDKSDGTVEAFKNDDGTITYTANVAGVPTEVNKITEQDGTIRFTSEFDGSIDWIKKNLGNGETITYKADVSGVQKDIDVYKDQDGTIHYYSTMDDGSKQELKQETNKDGTVTYTVDTSQVDEAVNDVEEKATFSKPVINLTADPNDAYGVIEQIKIDAEKESVALKGSVDLTNRPQIDAQKLKDVGWENAGEGTATVYSSSYSNDKGDKTVVVTPILPNGDVFEPEALDNYARELLGGQSDTEGLEIRTYLGEDSANQAERYAESLHKVQEAYYLGDDAQKKALNSLSQYNALQLKSIDSSNMQSSEMGKAMSSLMNDLGVGTDSLQEFVDVLTDMNLIDSGVDIKVSADTSDAESRLEKLSLEDIPDKVVKLIGEDNASTIIELWEGLNADPKFTSLTADDQANAITELWNISSANPKFTSLSAQDQATFIVGLWNGLTPELKEAILKADPAALEQATIAANACLNEVESNNPNPLISADDQATSIANSVKSTLAALDGTSSNTYIYTHHVDTYESSLTPLASSGGEKKGKKKSFNGTANAHGNWSVKKSEESLVGELGRETIVRNGRYFTVGDNGAEFVSLRSGDIVFNHKQTEELFKNGYVTSGGGRAKLVGEAFANGTAYASGGRLPSASSSSSKKKSSSSSSSSSSNSSSSKSSSNSSSSSSSNSSSSSDNDSEKVIDWIETLLSRVKRITDLAVDAIDRTVGLVNKQAKAAEAISKVQDEIRVNQEAAQAYLNKANSIGLSDVYKEKIRNGELTVETVTDETLQKNIEDYKSYYESYLSALDNVNDLTDKLTELAEKRLSIIEDQYDAITDLKDAVKDGLEENRTLLENLGTSINSDANKNSIKQSISTQSQIYSSLTKKLAEYEAEVSSQLKSGLMKKGSEQWYEAQKNIQEFSTNITKASSELIELQDSLRQIQYDVLQYAIDGYSRKSDKLSAYIDLLDAQDRKVPEKLYQQQINSNDNQIAKQYNLRAKYLKEQGKYDVNSKRYQELAEKINDADTKILELRKDNESLKDSIYELRFANIDKAIQKYSDLEDELSNMRDLLNSDGFIDKKGGITDEGLANIALLSQSIGNAKQKIADYTTGLTKLYQTYKNGVISADEYNEKAQEYRQGIQEATKDVKSYQDSLKDLYLKSMQTEVDYLDKIISKRKEALQAKASYYEYDKKIKSQTKDINSLKAQIAALEGVNRLLHL